MTCPFAVIIAFVAGVVFAWLLISNRRPSPAVNMEHVRLRRLAIRLRYLSQEGTLSKSGDTVRFDADGPGSANELMETIMEIVETVE